MKKVITLLLIVFFIKFSFSQQYKVGVISCINIPNSKEVKLTKNLVYLADSIIPIEDFTIYTNKIFSITDSRSENIFASIVTHHIRDVQKKLLNDEGIKVIESKRIRNKSTGANAFIIQKDEISFLRIIYMEKQVKSTLMIDFFINDYESKYNDDKYLENLFNCN